MDTALKDPTSQPLAWDPNPPTVVARARQRHRWLQLSFLHWAYDPDAVAPLLAPGLTVDTFNGHAWVGIVPFRLHVRVPGVPYLPWAGRFVETNVRTYVRGPDGTPGIWFLSLDAARLGAVLVARTAWQLPYMWSQMRLATTGDTVTYETRRRWPAIARPRSRITLALGDRLDAAEVTELDNFLTARWTLFSMRGTTLMRTEAHHEPWPLRRATVLDIDNELVTVAGLPAPTTPPRVLYSDGVDVRLGRRRAA